MIAGTTRPLCVPRAGTMSSARGVAGVWTTVPYAIVGTGRNVLLSTAIRRCCDVVTVWCRRLRGRVARARY